MKKAIALGLMTLIAGVAQADQKADQKVEKVEAVAAVSDEQAFVAKLSEAGKKAFEQMNVEQKKAALSAAKDAALTADAAVQKVLSDKK